MPTSTASALLLVEGRFRGCGCCHNLFIPIQYFPFANVSRIGLGRREPIAMAADVSPVPDATRNADVERFDKWASKYEKSVAQRWYFDPVHARMLDLIAQARPGEAPGAILDVGCGTGRYLRAVARRWPGARLFGVDPAAGMIAEAQRLQARSPARAVLGRVGAEPGIEFRAGAAEALPFPDGSFDGVSTSLSFHHWANQRQGVAEIARVLCPGGWFCLADHTFVIARWLGAKVRSRREIREMLAGAGLPIRLTQSMPFRCVGITLAEKSRS
jgi:ubiquinone/menaquinone biosynthesis C-methylase UbiE